GSACPLRRGVHAPHTISLFRLSPKADKNPNNLTKAPLLILESYRLGAIRDLRGDVGQLGALTAHDAADKCRQGVEMSGEVPWGGGGIALRECLAYGTIASEVIT